MKAIALLVLVALPLAFCYNLKAREYYEYAFETYRRQYKKEYASADEHMYRMQIFANNLDKIEMHNRVPSGYKMGVNKFSDMTLEEFKNAHFCGCFNGVKNAPKNVQELHIHAAPSVDWTSKGAVTPVKDQAACGSCWAFSATGALESADFLKNGKLLSFSEQQLVDCSGKYGNNGCGGGLMTSAFEYVKDNGLCLEEDYPYTAKDEVCKTTCKSAVKLSSYVNVKTNEESLAKAVTQQPVSVAVYADPFMMYQSGIFDEPCGEFLDHGVLAVGYGETDEGVKYWKVKNSWGEDWGEKGYIRMIKDIGGTGECGIAAMSTYPVV